MIVISNGEHCELFELFHKGSIQNQMQSRETEIGWKVQKTLWIKFTAAPIVPSGRSWLLKIISLSFAVRSKLSIHVLLVCAISGGEIGISLRSFFNLNSFVLDKRFNNWLAKIPS